MSTNRAVTAHNTFGANGLVSRWTNTAGLTNWQAFDPMGNVANVVDPNGGNLVAPLYSAWGKPLSFGQSPWGYGAQWGSQTEPSTGFVLMGYRYYDPQAGRFITRDPIGYAGGINLYAYAGNNPVNFADPSGLDVDLMTPEELVYLSRDLRWIGRHVIGPAGHALGSLVDWGWGHLPSKLGYACGLHDSGRLWQGISYNNAMCKL